MNDWEMYEILLSGTDPVTEPLPPDQEYHGGVSHSDAKSRQGRAADEFRRRGYTKDEIVQLRDGETQPITDRRGSNSK